MPLNRHIHLDLPGPRSTSGHWLQSSIAETISLPGKNTKEELKELQELKERSQEPEPRSQHAWVRRGAASTRVSGPDSICSMACFGPNGGEEAAPGNDPPFGCSIGLIAPLTVIPCIRVPLWIAGLGKTSAHA